MGTASPPRRGGNQVRFDETIKFRFWNANRPANLHEGDLAALNFLPAPLVAHSQPFAELPIGEQCLLSPGYFLQRSSPSLSFSLIAFHTSPVYAHPEIVFLMSSGTNARKKGLSMGSSRKRVSKILGAISPADAERLLVDWANLHDLPYPAELDDQCRILVKRNPQVFGPNALDWEWGQLTGFDLIDFRDLLRRMWTAPDRRSKDWYCFHLRAKFH